MAEQINDGGPAFPHVSMRVPGQPNENAVMRVTGGGMSLRTYAAIKLRVPESGIGWLDEMIREARRDDIAARAMEGLIASDDEGAGDRITEVPDYAYQIADAMLAARKKGGA